MTRSLERIVWVIAILIVAAIGVVQRSGNGDSPGDVEAGADSSRRQARDGGGRSGRERNALHSVRDEQELRNIANHALSAPSRTERYQRVMQILDRTTEENWMVLWKEYIRQTLEEGRIHETEWSLFMNRVGEVAGPEAMEYFTHNAQNEHTFNRREVLLGWATVDPDGAFEWLRNQPEDAQPPEFWASVLRGATARDAELALAWLEAVPRQHSPQVVRDTVSSLIQAEGIVKTAEALEEMAARYPDGSPPAHLTMFFHELKKRSQRMDWLSQSYPEFNHRSPRFEDLEIIFGIQAMEGR